MLGLVFYDSSISFQPVGLMQNGILRKHISGNLHHCKRGFKFMCKIIHKIFLHLRKKFLPVEIKKADCKPDKRQEKSSAAHNPEAHLPEHILTPVREVQKYMVKVFCEHGQVTHILNRV